MSARKIRPRLNIDLDAPLPITFEDNPEADSIGADEDLKGEGEVKKPATQKSVYATMMDKHDKEPKFGEVIEIPVVKILPEFEAECDQAKIHFQRPETYIRYEPTEDEIEQKFIEYDLDEEDEQFVERIRSRAEDNNLNEDELELIIDFFEKQSFKQREFKQLRLDAIKNDVKETVEALKAPGLEDEDVPCCVCNERDSADDNLIVFCDGCDIAIHQVCQGLQSVPEGTWLCDRCAYANEKKPAKQTKQTSLVSFCTPGHAELNDVKCMMCPERAGAMKRTSCGHWMHIACALWIPELYFSSDLKIVKTDRMPPARMGLECELCGIKGGCIQCTEKRCYSAYHATCAQLNAVTHMIKIEEDEKTGDMNYVSYCRRHTAIKRNEKLQKVATKEDLEVDIGRFIDKNTKKEVQRRCGRKFSKTLFNEICEYWKQKRFARKHGRRPLLRSLRVVVEEEAQQEKAAGRRIFHAQKKVLSMLRECTNFDKYEQMKALRLSMERVRLLTDQIKKRENVKKRHLMNMIEMFNLTLGIKPQKQEEDILSVVEIPAQQDNKPETEVAPAKPLVLAQADNKARTSPIKKKVQKTPAPARELSSSQNVIRSIENVISENSNSNQGPVIKTTNDVQQIQLDDYDEEDKENSNQTPVEKPANATANKTAAQTVTSPLRKSVATIQSKLTFFFKS